MNIFSDIALTREYSIRLLTVEDAKILQLLYEKCADFAFLVDGESPSPSAAHDEFSAVPEGKTIQDKFILGLFDKNHICVGMIESIRRYPDDQSWWLGLMMLAPEYRGKGLGSEFYKLFERWVVAQGAQQIQLSVVEANGQGFNFWKQAGFEVIRKTSPQQMGKKIHALHVMKRKIIATD